MPNAFVESVCVGQSVTYRWAGHDLRSSIFKYPVDGPVALGLLGLQGDAQADLNQHGGPDKAVYVYAGEDCDWWAGQLGRAVEPAQFGQNLTVRGIDPVGCLIGEIWQVGSAIVQITEPRTPCWKLGLRLGDPRFPRLFAASGRTGVMLRVLRTGSLQAGDVVDVLHRPRHGITAADINDVYYRRTRDASAIERAPELARHWRDWVAHRTVWHLDDEQKKGLQVDA